MECITSESYSRVIQLGNGVGFFSVRHAPTQSALRVHVRFPRLDQLPIIISRIRRMFDLSAEPHRDRGRFCPPILSSLNWWPLARGLRLPGGWVGFEIAVRAILGQQITVKAATQLTKKIVAAFGDEVESDEDFPTLTHAFPRPARFTLASTQRVGLTQSRAAALARMAAAALADPHLFDPRRDLDQAVAKLRELTGIGEWTAQYIAMRAMGESDAFLAADCRLCSEA